MKNKRKPNIIKNSTGPPKVSIIVRTKNEERWISACLNKIKEQTVKEVEVILVDNQSKDRTVQRALSVYPDLKVVRLGNNFLPGYALNAGIRKSSGKYIVCLSAHCIPQKNNWLEKMLLNFINQPKLAGVYGRQISMHFTTHYDKRDLVVTFGLDKRVQKKDPFFHNANSMIPREVWQKYPFDEKTTNIEDRLWAKKVLDKGYYIIYEPEAPVYHHHGIYQNRNKERVQNVVKIMEPDINVDIWDKSNPFIPSKMSIPAVIPVREDKDINIELQKHLLKLTVKSAKESKFLSKVFVLTNNKKLAAAAKYFKADVPFVRPKELNSGKIQVIDVLKYFLSWHERKNTFFDYIVTMEITHPFRPKGMVDKCIKYILEKGTESVIAGIPEYRPCWWMDEEEYRRIDDFIRRRDKRNPLQVGLPALCSVLTPSLIRQNKRIGEQVGIVEFNDPLSSIEIRDNQSYNKVQKLLKLIDNNKNGKK